MTLKYFDIHSHIQFPQFNADKDAVLARMKNEGVWALVVGTDFKSSQEAIREVAGREGLFATVGLHPNDAYKEEFDLARYKELAKNEKVVAIGECGLDYFRIRNNESGMRLDDIKMKQRDVFEKHIELALELDKPLMLHCRDAHDDMIDMLKSKKSEHEGLRGNIHFFTGTKEIAKKYFDIGFTVSFTGVLTFTHDYDEVVKYAPLNLIMSETDCPFAAPVPHRGRRNEPVYVKEVVKRIAEIHGEDFEIVRETLVQNALRMFAI